MRQRTGRQLNRLLLFDKPSGVTSNKALQKIKKIYNATKAGHTGSLDPIATGLLIICFGATTKISQFLLDADKRYEVIAKLGVVTDTGDADGVVKAIKDVSNVNVCDIEQQIKVLAGKTEQIPPMYSALKYQGKRLYELARKGIEVKRAKREVKIHSFKLIQKHDSILKLTVHCSKGTYVRTLIEDLGDQLGCGAHVVELRRTSIGPFIHPKMVTISELEELNIQSLSVLDKVLVSAELAFQDWPAVTVRDDLMTQMHNGHPVWIEGTPTKGRVRIYDATEKFYGIGTLLDDGRIAPKALT